MVDLDELAAAIDVIPNDIPDYNGWKAFGMAIFAATGDSDYGLELFDKFSQRWKCGQYDEAATRKGWQAIAKSPPDRIGVGTIFHRANQAAPSWRSVFRAKQAERFSFFGARR